MGERKTASLCQRQGVAASLALATLLMALPAREAATAPEQGNCKDYAVTKRHELLARGWPSGALLLAEVVLASGEHHLVLVIRMREADLILDNLKSEIGTVAQSTYRWIRMQQQDNPNYWLAFDVAHARPMAANAFWVLSKCLRGDVTPDNF